MHSIIESEVNELRELCRETERQLSPEALQLSNTGVQLDVEIDVLTSTGDLDCSPAGASSFDAFSSQMDMPSYAASAINLQDFECEETDMLAILETSGSVQGSFNCTKDAFKTEMPLSSVLEERQRLERILHDMT